jgi:hypothetical protein
MLPYWIQHADFLATDHEPVDVAEALRLMATHPWEDELALGAGRENSGLESCPPGIGFVAPGGELLHVCPTGDGRALVHYHAASRGGLPGLVRGHRTAVHTRESMLLAEVGELIHFLFHGQGDSILRKYAPPGR